MCVVACVCQHRRVHSHAIRSCLQTIVFLLVFGVNSGALLVQMRRPNLKTRRSGFGHCREEKMRIVAGTGWQLREQGYVSARGWHLRNQCSCQTAYSFNVTDVVQSVSYYLRQIYGGIGQNKGMTCSKACAQIGLGCVTVSRGGITL